MSSTTTDLENVDRISNLPEWIVGDILSRLSTEEAVATSVLSTKWRSLWRNIHTISFSNCGRKSQNIPREDLETTFETFVHNVLKLIGGKSIDKFSLEVVLDRVSKGYSVSDWIATAVSLNAKVIKTIIDIRNAKDIIDMPCSLFTCKTLQVLRVCSNDSVNLNVPSIVSLPNVKTLSLEYVIYQSDESFCNLISGCSSLEILNISRYPEDNVLNLSISSSTLKKLTLKSFTKAESSLEKSGSIQIDAPQLKYIELIDQFTSNFSVENLCLLDEAHIDLPCYQFGETLVSQPYSTEVLQLFKGLRNVRNLTLTVEVLPVFLYASLIPRFPRVSQLTVELIWCTLKPVLNLLESLEKLEFLTVLLTTYYYNGPDYWTEPEKVPPCFLSCLHTVSVLGVIDREDDIEVIAYILKYAKVLQKLTVEVTYLAQTDRLEHLRHQLSEFPRASQECEITIVDHFLNIRKNVS